MQGVAIALLAFTIAAQTQPANRTDDAHCIWYGECYTNEYEKTFNCPYDGPGHKVEDDWSRRVLLDLCPNIYENGKFEARPRSEFHEFDRQFSFARRCGSCVLRSSDAAHIE